MCSSISSILCARRWWVSGLCFSAAQLPSALSQDLGRHQPLGTPGLRAVGSSHVTVGPAVSLRKPGSEWGLLKCLFSFKCFWEAARGALKIGFGWAQGTGKRSGFLAASEDSLLSALSERLNKYLSTCGLLRPFDSSSIYLSNTLCAQEAGIQALPSERPWV